MATIKIMKLGSTLGVKRLLVDWIERNQDKDIVAIVPTRFSTSSGELTELQIVYKEPRPVGEPMTLAELGVRMFGESLKLGVEAQHKSTNPIYDEIFKAFDLKLMEEQKNERNQDVKPEAEGPTL